MDDPLVPSEPSASLAGQEAATLNEPDSEGTSFASRLKQMRETYLSRREELLLSITQLDEDFTKSKAALKQELHEAQLERQRRLVELQEHAQKDNSAKVFGKIPAEILSYIFEECVEGDLEGEGGQGLGTSPWLLALVCRFWCRTALGTPWLWRKILVTDYSQFYWMLKRNRPLPVAQRSVRVRSHSALQVCLNRAEVVRALQRSGAAPLEITLGISGRVDALNTLPSRTFYEGMYTAVFNDHTAGRISRLVAEGNSWAFYASGLGPFPSLNLTLSTLVSLEIHSLTVFSATLENDEPMLKTILTSAKKLRSLRVGTEVTPDLLRHHNWQASTYAAAITNLTELRVSQNGHLDSILSGPVDLQVLTIDAASRIETVAEEGHAWEEITYPWPYLHTPEITFLCLARIHLILDDFSLLDRLKFPVLEELRLTQSSSSRRSRASSNENTQPPSIPDFILDLPKLRALRVASLHIAQMSHFIMPQLENLHITSTCSSQSKADADFAAFISEPTLPQSPAAFPNALPSDSLQSVLHLYLSAMLSEKGTMSTLKAFPSLETLRLIPGRKIGKSVIKGLTVGRHRRHADLTLCPRLKVLELDCYSFREWDKTRKTEIRVGSIAHANLSQLMEGCMKSRKKWGDPLDRCIVTFDT
jgi:F-box-like